MLKISSYVVLIINDVQQKTHGKGTPPPQMVYLKNDNHLEKTWEDLRNLILFNDRFTKGTHIAER